MIIRSYMSFICIAFGILFVQPARAAINEFKDDFATLRFFLEVPLYSVDIKGKVAPDHHVDWVPNLRTLQGADISINNFISVGAGWAGNDEPGSATKKGVTTYNDYRVGLTLRGFRGQANYQRFNGFYIQNTADVDPTISNVGNYIQDSSMVGGNISVSGIFVARPDSFSYTALLNQDARQEKSGGSFLYGFSASDTFFSTGNGLIPTNVRSSFGEDQNTTSLEFYGLLAKAGYGYSFILKERYFISLSTLVGVGAEDRIVKDPTHRTEASGGTTEFDAQFSTGYNGNSFLIAFIATADNTQYTTQSLLLPSTLADFKFALGIHF